MVAPPIGAVHFSGIVKTTRRLIRLPFEALLHLTGSYHRTRPGQPSVQVTAGVQNSIDSLWQVGDGRAVGWSDSHPPTRGFTSGGLWRRPGRLNCAQVELSCLVALLYLARTGRL